MSLQGSPEVSVLLCVYNGENYLRDALDSILDQTFTNYEFIVVNDGSTDSTDEILQEYASNDMRIRLVNNETNLGLTPSLNRGLAIARGEFIARQDADDISYPLRLERQVSWMNAHPKVGLLGTYYDVICQAGLKIETVTPPVGNAQLQQSLLKGNVFGHGTVMIRRQALSSVGYYSESYLWAEDYELWLRLSEIVEIANLPETLYAYQSHDQSISRRRLEGQVKSVCQAHRDTLIRRKDSKTPSLDGCQLLISTLLSQGYRAYLCRNIDVAKPLFRKAYEVASTEGSLKKLENQIGDLANRVEVQGGLNLSGNKFIDTVCGDDNGYPPRLKSRILSSFFIQQAFINKSKNKILMRRNLINGLIANPRWLTNRGIQSMIFISLFGKSPRSFIRQIMSSE